MAKRREFVMLDMYLILIAVLKTQVNFVLRRSCESLGTVRKQEEPLWQASSSSQEKKKKKDKKTKPRLCGIWKGGKFG